MQDQDTSTTACSMIPAQMASLRDEYLGACSRQPWGEAAAVAVLLGFEALASDGRLARRTSSSGVDWDAVLDDRTWSPSERFLVATAAGLWRGRRTQADISRVPFLDDAFFAVWLDMVTAARTGRVPTGTARHETDRRIS